MNYTGKNTICKLISNAESLNTTVEEKHSIL